MKIKVFIILWCIGVISVVGYVMSQASTKRDIMELRAHINTSLDQLQEQVNQAQELFLFRDDIRKQWEDHLDSDYTHEYSEMDRQLIALAIDEGHLLGPEDLDPRLYWDENHNSVPFGLEFSTGVQGVPAFVIVVASVPQGKRAEVSHILNYVVYAFDIESERLYRISPKSLWCKEVKAKGPWSSIEEDDCFSDKIKGQVQHAFDLL